MMIFLSGPELGEPKEKWMEWLSQLAGMDKRDVSVKFATERAQRIIREIEEFEAETGMPAYG